MYTPNTPAALESTRERTEAAMRLKELGTRYGLVVEITGFGLEQKTPVAFVGAGGFVDEPIAEDVDGDGVLLQYGSSAGLVQKTNGVVPNRLRSMSARI